MTATRQKIKQPPKRRIKMSTEDKIYNIIGLIVFTIITLICVYPFYYLMICTISEQKAVDLNQIILLPRGITTTLKSSKSRIWAMQPLSRSPARC